MFVPILLFSFTRLNSATQIYEKVALIGLPKYLSLCLLHSTSVSSKKHEECQRLYTATMQRNFQQKLRQSIEKNKNRLGSKNQSNRKWKSIELGFILTFKQCDSATIIAPKMRKLEPAFDKLTTVMDT